MGIELTTTGITGRRGILKSLISIAPNDSLNVRTGVDRAQYRYSRSTPGTTSFTPYIVPASTRV